MNPSPFNLDGQVAFVTGAASRMTGQSHPIDGDYAEGEDPGVELRQTHLFAALPRG